jgi:hypothetical protein
MLVVVYSAQKERINRIVYFQIVKFTSFILDYDLYCTNLLQYRYLLRSVLHFRRNQEEPSK